MHCLVYKKRLSGNGQKKNIGSEILKFKKKEGSERKMEERRINATNRIKW
jgi:hypothetical protein